MELTLIDADTESLRAGYACPCGCTPSVHYHRAGPSVEDRCCCGNRLAIGRGPLPGYEPRPGFDAVVQTFEAPWGEPLEAAWLLGSGTHAESHEPEGHHS